MLQPETCYIVEQVTVDASLFLLLFGPLVVFRPLARGCVAIYTSLVLFCFRDIHRRVDVSIDRPITNFSMVFRPSLDVIMIIIIFALRQYRVDALPIDVNRIFFYKAAVVVPNMKSNDRTIMQWYLPCIDVAATSSLVFPTPNGVQHHHQTLTTEDRICPDKILREGCQHC